VDSTGRDRALLSSVVFAVLFAQLLLYPGLPDLVVALGATPADWAGGVDEILDAGMWFLTAEFVGGILVVILWGALSDASGVRVPLTAAGAAIGALCYLLIALLPSIVSLPYSTILALRFVQGAATIGAFSLAITTLMDLDGGHGQNMGAAGLAIGAGAAIGSPIGGQLYTVGPLVPLVGSAVLMGCAALLVTQVTDRTPGTATSVTASLTNLRTVPELMLPYALGFIDRMTAGFFALVGTVYFQATFDLGAAETGILLGAFFVPFALLQYPLGRLSDRIGRVIPVAIGSLAYGGAVISVFYAPTPVTAGLLMALVGVLGALVAPATMALVTDLADERTRGAAMGGFNVFGSLGFLGGFVIGATVAASYGFKAAFFVVGVAEIAIAVVALPVLLRLDIPALPWR